MKLFLIFILLVLLAGSVIGELIVQDPGYVLFSFKNTTLETSIWGLGLILLVSFTSLYLLIQLTQYLLQRRSKIRKWSVNRNRKQAHLKTLSGLNALSAGDWSKAQRLLSQAAPHSDVALVNYLAAARAAHEQNQPESCDELLEQAHRSAPKAEVAIGVIQSQIQIERNEWQPALETLVRLRKKAPKHTLVLKLLTQAYSELKDWGSIVQLLPDLRKYHVYDGEQLEQLSQTVYLGHLQNSLGSLSSGTEDTVRTRTLMQGWKSVPKALQNDATLIERQVELLLQCNATDQADAFIKERLKKHWQPALVNLYGRIAATDPDKQYQQALRWQRVHPKDATLQLTLGRLALRNQQWPQAQKHFETSLEQQSSTEAYAELARLLQHLPDDAASQQLLQQHVSTLTEKLPNLPQPALPRPEVTETPPTLAEAKTA
ncbi:MAG: HemY protein [Motiliproteus sp.]|jgi:HemY protein